MRALLDRIEQWGRTGLAAWRARPSLRCTLIGGALVVVALLIHDSWIVVPLIAVGGLTLMIGMFGPRLRGKLTVHWGPGGTVVEMRGELLSPAVRPALEEPRVQDLRSAEPVVEGSGETIEMEIAQLHALLAAERAAGRAD